MYYSQLKQRLKVVQNQIKTLQEDLLSYPEGFVHTYRYGKYTKWFVQYPRKRVFIPHNKRSTLIPLARGTYLRTKLKDLQTEEKAILAYISVQNTDISAVDKLFMEPDFYEMVKEFASYPKAEIREWTNQSYERWTGHPEQLIHETVHGFNTRSKAESMIVDALAKRGIPFRYEHELKLSDGCIYHPDFTIMHPLSGKLLYWEHLGKMDDWDYVQANMQKLKLYALHGIIPGINLIITSETKSSPLSQATIEKVIDLYLGEAKI